ncbi:MAG: DUF4329 domain-containing protein, partial [Desulfobacteraceae bacterium]|nr:DUF4329 domain-containing protein [Desulfobacteraceae bacterium]
TVILFDYAYDLAGRLASKAVTKDNVAFKTLNYAFYPGTSLLKRVSDANNTTLSEISLYSPQGKMEAVSFNGGKTVTTYSYIPETGRLSTLNAYTVPGGQSIIYKVYDYNKSGDITGLHDLKNDIDYAYAYDPLHRLISEQSSGGGASAGATVEVIEFTYTEEEGQPVHAPVETSLNGASTQYAYTATGTRLTKQEGLNTTTYQVDYDNQIQTITAGGVVTNFFYDADGKRIKKTQGSSTTLYFGEDLEIINNAPTLYAFAGNLRIAKMTGAATEYYHKDHQGSTNAISDQNGTVVDTAEYLPYGPDRYANALLNHSAYKYTDQEQDAGTGLYNYDARLYDPNLGQFVMADTIVPDPYNPQSLNRYAYCLNNPIRYVDPTGHHTGGYEGPGHGDGGYDEGPGGFGFGGNSSGNGGGGSGQVYDLGDVVVRAEAPSDVYSGDKFKTIPDVVTHARDIYYFESWWNDYEIGGPIYQDESGNYYYPKPTQGEQNSVEFEFNKYRIKAWWHTHGAVTPDYDEFNFSTADQNISKEWGIPGYLIDPNSNIHTYIPDNYMY